MKKVVNLFILTLLATTAHAQHQEYYAAVYFMPSIQFFNFNNLNKVLKQNGFPETRAVYANGIGGFGKINQWRVGGEGVYFSHTVKHSSPAKTTINGGLGYFYGGYELSHGRWQFIPTIGIGLGGATVNASKTSNSDLGNLLSNQPNSSTVSNGNALAHLGLSADRIVSSNFYLALKAGYNVALGKNEWDAPGLVGSVSDPFQALHVNLSVGFLLR